MNDKKCPICGIGELEIIPDEIKLSDTFGGELILTVNIYKCTTCESEGDFFNKNEKIIASAYEDLNNKAVHSILESLRTDKIKMAGIERALGLPQRTITKWKNNVSKPSASALAMLKFIRTFPWLLEVADNGFEPQKAQRIAFSAIISTAGYTGIDRNITENNQNELNPFLVHTNKNTDSLNLVYGGMTEYKQSLNFVNSFLKTETN